MLASGKAAGMSMAPGEVVNLSTITEESENYKNSTCSSRFTVSSGSSRSVGLGSVGLVVVHCTCNNVHMYIVYVLGE